MWTKSHRSRMWTVSATLAVVAVTTAAWGTARAHRDDEAERYLYVWAGDQARTAPDFLAVVDFDPASAQYGKVITTRTLPEPGATGNEPHHVGLSSDGRTL